MREAMMKSAQTERTRRAGRRGGMKTALLLAAACIGLSGCVVYPSSYGYGYGGYYAAPAVVAAPVVVGGGWGWRGGWGWHRGCCWR